MKEGAVVSVEFDTLPLELISRRLKALADASRLGVVHCLCGGERSVTELVELTGLGQANVSKHLRILKSEGFVVARRSGRNVLYRVSGTLPEEICTIICRSMKKTAAGEGRLIERYLERKRVRKAG
jgi:DNA-binding transcriptional ArsR family regulator